MPAEASVVSNILNHTGHAVLHTAETTKVIIA